MPRSRSYAVEVLKAHPVVTSIIVALAASAILNRVLAKRAERRSTTLSEEQGPRSSYFMAMGV
jgi:hypothetical protein